MKNNKNLSILGLSVLLLSFNTSAEECDFNSLIEEINISKYEQNFSEYFSPSILHEFRMAKYREYNTVDYLQFEIHGEDHPDFGKLLKQIMMGHIARITQDKSLADNYNIDTVSASADRFKANIRSISHLDDYEFFNQYLTNSYRDSSLHYDFLKEAITSLSVQIDKTPVKTCAYQVNTNLGRTDFVQNVTFKMNNGVIVSPSPLVSMFDYQAGAYKNEDIPDNAESGIDFADVPTHLYPEGVQWWRVDDSNQ